MGQVVRRRHVAAAPEAVWDLIADPYSLPRWWPKTARVEAVELSDDGARCEWTKVLQTEEGRSVRADFRRLDLLEGERYAWEQTLLGSPFERHLRHSAIAILLRADDEGTEVTLTSDQRLRGLSRLGSPMMRRGQGAILEEALEGIERVLAGVR